MFDDFDFTGGGSGGGLVASGGGVVSDDGFFSGGVFDTLGKIGGAIGTVATSVAQFQAARDAQQTARQDQQFNRDLKLLDYDLAKTKATGQINVERERSQLQAAIERAKLAATNGLNGFYNTLGLPSAGQGGGISVGMIALAVGGYFLLKKLK